jgi:hypothetical protein
MRNPNLSQVPKFYKDLALYVEDGQALTPSSKLFFAEPSEIIGTKFPGLTESEIAACFEYLHSIGVVVLHKRSGFVCTRPHLIAKVMALFVGMHSHGCAIAPKPIVIDKLNQFLCGIGEEPLSDLSEQALFFDMLETLELCIPLSGNLQRVYGQEGYLFPALRPAGEVFVMPEKSYLAAMGMLTFQSAQMPLKWVARMWIARSASIPLELFIRLQVWLQAIVQSM